MPKVAERWQSPGQRPTAWGARPPVVRAGRDGRTETGPSAPGSWTRTARQTRGVWVLEGRDGIRTVRGRSQTGAGVCSPGRKIDP